MKFTFKKYIPTGQYRSFELGSTDIKMKGHMVGQIAQTRDEGWRVGFTVKKEATKESPAPFKWVFFKVRFSTEKEARVDVIKAEEQIQKRFDLYQFEK